jgi:hypothetical protein
VDLLARYSNHEDQLGSLLELLERMAARDQTNVPGLEVIDDRARTPPHCLSQRLPEGAVSTMIQRFEGGATIQAIAGEFDISPSSVKRILRGHGVRRR